MGLAAMDRSRAARSVWERADQHTRRKLGFSILRVVRDNPKALTVRGSTYNHPKGVLHLTQFTQVGMAVLAAAQVEELRELGMTPEDVITCGHSVGEYNALGACAGVLPLEAVVEVVWHRGSAMARLVGRDENGRSGFAMAAVRPAAAGLDQSGLEQLVRRTASRTRSFLEVVNYNVRDWQYAVTGELDALDVLQREIEGRIPPGGRKAWITVPGIDVPFHSTLLRGGVASFRDTLEAYLPEIVPWRRLIGRYVPNLVGRPFAMTPDFVQAAVDATDSCVLARLLCDWPTSMKTPDQVARTLLVELLAWQFASPVRWIETQERMFTSRDQGGMGVEQVVEIGVGYQPTLRNMSRRTLAAWPAAIRPDIITLNLEADRAELLDEDADPAPVVEESESSEATPASPTPAAAVVTAAFAASSAPVFD
jgi:fatty acid synthase